MSKTTSQTDSPEGGEALTKRLHAEHGAALFNWAVGRVADRRDAEELVAETLVRAWRKYDQYDPDRGTERAWLFGIARNASADLHRKSRRLRIVGDNVGDQAHDGGIDRLAEASVIRDALGTLSDPHRAVIVEAFFQGRTAAEIGERIGVPPGTVKSRMFYGMRALRAALEEREVLR